MPNRIPELEKAIADARANEQIDPRQAHVCVFETRYIRVPVDRDTGLVITGKPVTVVQEGRAVCKLCGRVRD